MGMSSKQVSSDHLELSWSPNMLTSSEPIQSSNPASRPTNMKRSSSLQTQPQPDTLKCPRCDSSNTKFCYYNNYNKTQPRHYCKACKRHWTKGGTLRNVPVGGGRKNKRVKRPATTTTTTATTIDHNLGFSDQKYMFPDDNNNNKSKGYNNLLFNKPNITSDQFDQVSWDFNGGFSSAMQQQQQSSSSATAVHQNLGFSILSSMDDDTNTVIPVIPASSYSPLLLSGFKDDSTSVTTTRMMMPNISQPWMQQVPSHHPSNNLLEASTFWTWNDIDYMVQGDMNKPFEDPHMKH